MATDIPRASRLIASIASAPGWAARINDDGNGFGEPGLVTLAAWALVEGREGQRELVGLVQNSKGGGGSSDAFDFADEVDGFAGYSHQGLRTKRAD